MGAVYFTLTKGEVGTKVPDSATIYNSQACTKPIRIGKKTVTVKKETPDVSFTDLDDIKSVLSQTTNVDTETQEATITGKPVEIPISSIEEAILKDIEKCDDMYEAIDANVEVSTGARTILTWVEDMIAFVDALPTIYSDGTIVYEVEKNDIGEYIYNGNYGVINVEWNERVQKAKVTLCRKLNNAISVVTDTATSWIESVTPEIGQSETAMDFVKGINIKGISIDTIIGWAKNVIKFFTWFYQTIYKIYTTAMAILEAVVIRVPQLISKITKKIFEFNCSIKTPVPKLKAKLPSNKKK